MSKKSVDKCPYIEVRLDENRQQYVIDDLWLRFDVEYIDNINLYKALKGNRVWKMSRAWFFKPKSKRVWKMSFERFVVLKTIELMKNYGS